MILGLTGGIASGKSTVSKVFKQHHIPVVDADLVARDVMRAGQPVVLEIEKVFGSEYLLANGEINREKLGQTVFADSDKRKQLDHIVQGEIRKEIKRRTNELVAQKHPFIVLDIPLLFEGGFDKNVDTVMCVYVTPETQLDRLVKRNTELTEEDARNRMASQMSLDEKAKQADVVIDNNGTIEETTKQVEEWLAGHKAK